MRRLVRLLPLLGILAIVLVAIGIVVVGNTPDTDDPISKIVSFYTKHDSDLSASGGLLVVAAIAFLAWSVQLRNVLFLGEGGSATRATLGLVGSVLFAVGMTLFGGINLALGDAPKKYDPAVLQTLNVLGQDLFPPIAVGGILTLFGYGLAVLKTRALPVWLGWIAIIGALFVLTPLWFMPFIALALLIIVSSVLLAMGTAVT
jgi:hypothetical protein